MKALRRFLAWKPIQDLRYRGRQLWTDMWLTAAAMLLLWTTDNWTPLLDGLDKALPGGPVGQYVNAVGLALLLNARREVQHRRDLRRQQ